MGGPGGHWPPLLVKFRAIFDFSGNLSKCPYILPEKFLTAITSLKKGHHLFGLTFGDISRPKMMEKVLRDDLFFFWRCYCSEKFFGQKFGAPPKLI